MLQQNAVHTARRRGWGSCVKESFDKRWQLSYVSVKIQSEEERVETVGERLAYIWKYRGFLKRTLFGDSKQGLAGGEGRVRGGFRGEMMEELAFRSRESDFLLWWDRGCYGVETWHSGTFQWERGCSRFWSGHWTRDTEVFRGLNNCQIHGRDHELHLGSLLGFPSGRLAK